MTFRGVATRKEKSHCQVNTIAGEGSAFQYIHKKV